MGPKENKEKKSLTPISSEQMILIWVNDFFSFSVKAHFHSRAIAQHVSLDMKGLL